MSSVISSISLDAFYTETHIAVRVKGHRGSIPRSPFHIALALDKSGSMAGARMEEVKRTCHRLIDLLEPIDSVSILLYNHGSSVLLNTIRMDTDRAAHHAAIDTIHADGGTNLEAALMQLPSLTSIPDSVFLLTDGHINQGQCTPAALMTIIKSILPPHTPVHMVGFGKDHDQRLLQGLGLQTGGTYSYADSDEMIPIIVGDIVGGLSTEMGRAAHVQPPAGYRSLEMMPMIGRLIDDKTHWVVFEKTAPDSTLPAAIEFHWKDSVDHVDVVVPVLAADVPLIEEQILRASTATQMNDILEQIARRVPAQPQLEALKKQLDESSASTRPLIIQLRAQVDGLLADLAARPSSDPAFLSRLASTQMYAGTQAGVVSLPPVTPGEPARTCSLFSSPCQAGVSRSMSQRPGDPTESSEEDATPSPPEAAAAAAAAAAVVTAAAAPSTPPATAPPL
jgi:hypothetical protein